MKAKFQAGERIILLGLLPPEANLLTLRIIQEMKRKIGITAEEYKSLEMKFDEAKEQARWNPAKDLPVEIEFADAEREVMVKVLQKLDKDAKLTEAHLTLCEKFKV